jgi:dienelactone hydrolase
MAESVIGAYGRWAASLNADRVPSLSFRQPAFKDLETWRVRAKAAVLARMALPRIETPEAVEIVERVAYDGLEIERLRWRLAYGPPTEAVVLRPAGARGRLPGVVALHCHGGIKYLGLRKVAAWGERAPFVAAHHEQYYGGLAWANELARRGYVVLAHDVFPFASRCVRPEDCPEPMRGICPRPTDADPESVAAFNAWAGPHEHQTAKALLAAGTTFPAVVFSEDRVALDILARRDDVDGDRLGCAGLSGGGLRTVYLAGLDDRIRCCAAVGFITTWRDMVLNKCYTHTWMAFIPLLAGELDFPEILSLRMPRATLVQNTTEDALYTLAEVRAAEAILREAFAKAGAADRFDFRYYPGPHKFDRPMQADAFDWFDRWLKG